MKTNVWRVLAAIALAGLSTIHSQAAQTATVKADIINVRGKPTLFSEVVTQLKQGESVTILEEITIAKPKAGEPQKWARIQMPANVPLWINAGYIDGANNTVKARKLNLRAGPGENYSVVGLLVRGDSVKPIRSKQEWMEIESVTNSYAFVSSDLLEAAAETPAVVEAPAAPKEKAAEKTVVKSEPAKVEVPVATPPPAPTPVTVETVKADQPAEPAHDAPTPAPAKPVAPKAVTAVPAPVLTPPPVAPPVQEIDEPAPRRIVRREGVVHMVGSIQAPTTFQLQSADNGELINYLHSSKTNISLQRFQGQKVIVTGEEYMDERWTNTPMIEIDVLQPAPNSRE
jgi:uncharacterized protein YgiM (DUF1202 family)